jgi:hypothetical protein
METKSGFPYAELEFDKEAGIVKRKDFDELLDAVAEGDDPADVLVFVHGWNNDMDEARDWYGELAQKFRTVLDGPHCPAGASDRRFLILGVLWPSKKWAERSLIAGGAASAEGGTPHDDEIVARLDELKGFFDADGADDRLEKAKALVPQLEDDPDAQDEFVELIRELVPPGAKDDPDDYTDAVVKDPGQKVLERLEAPVEPEIDDEGGGAQSMDEWDEDEEASAEAGGAAGLGFLFSGIKAGAERFLNLTTYYQMKERAGTIGATGLNPCLRKIRERRKETRLHLIGHSFGGRLVTAATMGDPSKPAVKPDTVTLLQAAFSHYGFAAKYRDGDKDGFFRAVVTGHMSAGPILITHSKRDMAVGYAYPLASRLAGQDASFLGDENDRFGGIGRNGAQDTPERDVGTLEAVGGSYTFSADKLHNLNADRVIGGHSDIRRDEVAYAVLSGIATPVP